LIQILIKKWILCCILVFLRFRESYQRVSCYVQFTEGTELTFYLFKPGGRGITEGKSYQKILN